MASLRLSTLDLDAAAPLAGRRRAMATLGAVGLVALIAFGEPAELPPNPRGSSDVTTFSAVAQRMRDGQPYYEAMGAELRARGYPTSSLFNWRTPLHLTLTARAPATLVWPLWLVVCVGTWVAAVVAFRRGGRSRWGATTALTTGAVLLLAAPAMTVLGEAPAGLLLLASVAAYRAGHPLVGTGCAVAALFFRELAAPYCVAMTLLAAARRRTSEVSAWAAGALLYGAYFLHHASAVAAVRSSGGVMESGWFELGGVSFLLTTAHWLGWWFWWPLPLTVIALALLCAGIADARCPSEVRLATATYLLFFLVAGKPFNHYWGILTAPLWAVSAAHGLSSLSDQVRVLARHPAVDTSRLAPGETT